MLALVARPDQAVKLLSDKVQPAKFVQRHLTRLLAELSNEDFKVRARASSEIRDLGSLAVPALEKLVSGKVDLEVFMRAKRLLRLIDEGVPSARMVPQLRAIEVLEWLGTPQARRALRKISEGTPALRLTEESRAALERLEKVGGRNR
jgi:hypothetical protein